MTEQELFNEYRKSNCKSFSDFLINKIVELETENERLTVSYETLKLHDEEEIGMLKSENAELKKKCYKKAVKDYCELEKENAELKAIVRNTKAVDESFAKLQQENAELKRERKRLNDNYHYWNIKACHIDQELYDTKRKLTKAKDHIKKLLDCLKQDTNDPQTNYYVCQYMDKAEQFLSEVEK